MLENLNENIYNNFSKEKLKNLIIELIDKYHKKDVSDEEFLDELLVLVNISLLSYIIIDEKENKILGNLLYNIFFTYCIFGSDKFNKIDKIYYIIINFGLQECYEKILDTLIDNDMINDKRDEILLYCNYIYAANGSYISDVYYGLGKNN